MPPEAQAAPNTQQPVVAPPPPANPEGVAPDDVDARAAALIEDIRAGKFSDDDGAEEVTEAPAKAPPANDAETETPGNDNAETAANDNEAAPTDADKERLAKIARATEIERAARDKASKAAEKERAADEKVRRAEEREQRATELLAKAEAKEKQLLDKAHLVQFIKKNLTGAEVAQLITDDLDPARSAEMALERTVTPKLAEMQAKIDAYERRDQEAKARATQEAHQRAVVDNFLAAAKQGVADKPYARALLEKRPEEFAARADAIALRLVAEKGATDYNEVLSKVESELSDFAALISPQPSGEVAAPSEAAHGTAAPAPRARTLTNRTSAGRSTLAQDDDSLAGLDARADELKRLARKSG